MKVVSGGRSLASWSLALAAVLAMLSAQADTWYLNDGTPSSGVAFSSDASYWTSDTTHEKGSGALNPNDHYIVSGYQLRAKNTFGGGSLAIGDLAAPNYASRICMDAHLTINVPFTLNVGYIYINTYSSSYVDKMGTYTIEAPQTEVTAPADKPFGFYANYAWRTIKLTSLSGAEGTGIVVGGNYSSKGVFEYDAVAKSNFVFYAVDASAYKGDIKVISNGTLAPNGWDAALKLDTASFNALDVSAGSELQAVAATNVLTVKELTLHAGSRLRPLYLASPGTASVLRVTSAFTMPEDEGTVEVRLNAYPAQAYDGVARAFPLLTVPDEQELDASRFFLSGGSEADARHLALSVLADTESRTKSLCLTVVPTARLTTADNTTYKKTQGADVWATYTSAFEQGEGHWSDDQVPREGVVYEFGQQTDFASCIRTPYMKDYDYEFPGLLLRSLGTQAFLVLADSKKTTVDFEATANTTYVNVVNGRDPTLDGALQLEKSVISHAYGGSVLTIAAAISGVGNWTVDGMDGTGSPQSTLVFSGDNGGWTGALTLKQASGKTSSGVPYPSYDARHPTLKFSAAENLGGDLASFNYKALSLAGFSELVPTAPVMLLASANRGVCVNAQAIFNVAEGTPLDCWWPVTFNGTLYKAGAGTLGLGGGVRFLDAEGTLTDEPPAEAEKHLLVVTNGCVKALAHVCLNGITLSLSPLVKNSKKQVTASSALSLPFNPEDADLKRYGFYNVKTTMPFLEGQTINIRLSDVDATALEAARATEDGYKQGLITVKTTAAKNVEDNLVVEKVKGLRLIREDDAETETTTFSLYGKKEGVLLIVR